MNITVIVCTFNRCEIVAQTLESVAASVLPESVQWEVLVVDNNSTDRTKNVAEDFCRRRPDCFRYIFEPKPGKSSALNAGIRNARSEVLAFLDDDVTVDPAWLRNLTQPLLDAEYAGVGGRTLLQRPFSPPTWLALYGPGGMGGIIAALFDLGEEPCDLDQPPYGVNMAFRRSMFEKYGLFRTDLGPSPSRNIPRPNEDTEFGRRLLAAGERLRYEPAAIVYHPAPDNRLQKSYFLHWWFDFGRAVVVEKGPRTPVWGIPRHFLSIPKMIALTLPLCALRWMRTANPQKRFSAKCLTWATAGQISEAFRMARTANAAANTPAHDQLRSELPGRLNP